MGFDMPHDEPADKTDYDAWMLENAADELELMIEEGPSEGEAEALRHGADAIKTLITSHRLLRHYAELLNEYDGGKRVIAESVFDWMLRCKTCAQPEKL